VQAAVVLSICALIATFVSINGLGSMLGIASTVLVCCTTCTQINKCGLVTAGVMGLVAGLVEIVGAVAMKNSIAQCEEMSVTLSDAFKNADDDFSKALGDAFDDSDCGQSAFAIYFGFIAAALWLVTGVLVFFIPPVAKLEDDEGNRETSKLVVQDDKA